MTSFRSNRSWDNGNLIRPYNSKTTNIGPFLHQDEYKASSYPEFRSPRELVEAAVRSSIARHELNRTSLINVYVSDSDGIGSSLPWATTVADEKNLYDMLLNNMHQPGSDVTESEITDVIIKSSGPNPLGGAGGGYLAKSAIKVVDFGENLCGPISLVISALWYDHKEAHERMRKLFPDDSLKYSESRKFDGFVKNKKPEEGNSEDAKANCETEQFKRYAEQFKADQATLKNFSDAVQNTNTGKLENKNSAMNKFRIPAAEAVPRWSFSTNHTRQSPCYF